MTENRFLSAISTASFQILPFDYCWSPMNPGQGISSAAIACIRDDTTWFEFTPIVERSAREKYCVVSFHFPVSAPASGFVGWLATKLKLHADTDAMVICGKDRGNFSELSTPTNGAFDYWCCPLEAKQRFLCAIETFINKGKALSPHLPTTTSNELKRG